MNLFLAVPGPHCWAVFSPAAESGGSSLVAGHGVSHCGGLSCCGAWARGRTGSSSCSK